MNRRRIPFLHLLILAGFWILRLTLYVDKAKTLDDG